MDNASAAWPVVADYGWKALTALATSLAVYYTSEKIKGRYRITQLTRRTYAKYYAQFAELYCDRIEPEQQISPSVIADHATDKQIAPTSKRALKKMGRGTDRHPTAHQLFLAVRRGQVIGFLCVFVNLRREYMFIAYLAVLKSPDTPADVTKRLLAKAQERATGVINQQVFFFEISPPATGSNSSKAKFRLFSEYARVLSMATKRVPISYVQPDMDPDSLDGSTEVTADLYISASPVLLDSLDKPAYLRFVRSIYFDIYLKSFPDLDLQPKYLEYLSSLYDLLEEENS